MAQQISDLVIKLDVDRATFSEQVARIKGQLTGMADESDKVQARMQRAADRQSAALKSVGDAGAAAAADMKARQSAATEGLTKDWQNVSRSVDETHRRVPGRSSGYLSARSCAVTSVRCAAPGSRWRTGQDGYPFNWSWVSANTFSSTTCH